MKKLLMLTAALWCLESQALQIKEAIEDDKIKVKISFQDLNRMSFKDDRIKNIYGGDGSFVLEHDDSFGQVFLKPTLENGKKPIHLTVITEKGLIQDLMLIPQDIPSETIIIRGAANQEEVETWEQGDRYKNRLIDLIRHLVQGIAPTGYEVKEVDEDISQWKDVEMRRVRVMKGSKYQGEVVLVTNMKLVPIKLTEKLFASKKSVKAISLDKKKLMPGETTELYRVNHV
jgi:type-F conjugative transfer system secretin TraK